MTIAMPMIYLCLFRRGFVALGQNQFTEVPYIVCLAGALWYLDRTSLQKSCIVCLAGPLWYLDRTSLLKSYALFVWQGFCDTWTEPVCRSHMHCVCLAGAL